MLFRFVKAYYKALISYAADNGSYPVGTGSWCLGEGYSCTAGTQNTTANNLIRKYLNNADPLPTPSLNGAQYGASKRYGAAYAYMSAATLDGSPYYWGISYILEGPVSCGLDRIAGNPPGQYWPNFSSTQNASGATERQTNNTWCRMILPDPATI